ncbi:hypothetical protein NMG60_11035733 [Bertholletia excelsa]
MKSKHVEKGMKKKKIVSKTNMKEENKVGEEIGASCSSLSSKRKDRLGEELSCAFCRFVWRSALNPASTTSCVHNNGRACTVNTMEHGIDSISPSNNSSLRPLEGLNNTEAHHLFLLEKTLVPVSEAD